jgi:uncharacterized protein YjgD (DUF1641 family)
MKHKDSNFKEMDTRVLTPEAIKEALNNLPFNYIKQVIELLTKQKEAGLIDKVYSIRYITMVKNQDDAFNEEVMNAIVQVGMANVEKLKRFGSKTKKTSQTN